MRQGIGPVLGRLAGVVAGLLVVGIVLKLVIAALSPVLPPGVMQVISAAWNTLFSIIGPALVPVTAISIVALACWALVGRRR